MADVWPRSAEVRPERSTLLLLTSQDASHRRRAHPAVVRTPEFGHGRPSLSRRLATHGHRREFIGLEPAFEAQGDPLEDRIGRCAWTDACLTLGASYELCCLLQFGTGLGA